MKFLTLFIVAALALSATAIATEGHAHLVEPQSHYFATLDVAEVIKTVYEFVKNVMYRVWTILHGVTANFFPTELTVAIENIFKYWPAFNQVYTPEFLKAVNDFVHALKKLLVPREFYDFFANAVAAFPYVTDVFPKEFFYFISRIIEYVPFARYFFEQLYYFFNQVAPYYTYPRQA